MWRGRSIIRAEIFRRGSYFPATSTSTFGISTEKPTNSHIRLHGPPQPFALCQARKLLPPRQVRWIASQSNKSSDPPESFDRTSDYDYDLQNLANGRSFRINLTREGFLWPDVDDVGAATALLELNIDTLYHDENDDDIYSCPSIDVIPECESTDSGKEVNIVQYFAHGERGRRYLELSPLLVAGMDPGTPIKLSSASGARWRSDCETFLTVFPSPQISGKRLLVLSTHPDDAEIAAYGLYTSSDANVVTITAGDAGKGKLGCLWSQPGEHYRAKGRIRTVDSLAVPLLGGLRPESIRNLGYYDGTLSQMWAERPNVVEPKFAALEGGAYFRRLNFDEALRNRPFRSSWDSLVADLLIELETVQPDVVVSPHPYLDSHQDHQYTTIALFEALSRWDQQGRVDIFLYTNHAIGDEGYPFGPSRGMMGLAPYANTDGGDELYITGIYSHLLLEEDRRQKLVALEAMHDLRPFDLRDGSAVLPSPELKYDYFRRAGRPNEIFYTTNGPGAARIYRNFLASKK